MMVLAPRSVFLVVDFCALSVLTSSISVVSPLASRCKLTKCFLLVFGSDFVPSDFCGLPTPCQNAGFAQCGIHILQVAGVVHRCVQLHFCFLVLFAVVFPIVIDFWFICVRR